MDVVINLFQNEEAMNKDPIMLTPILLDFIRRRSSPFIERHKSLETIVAGAYIQGMNDAIDALSADQQGTRRTR